MSANDRQIGGSHYQNGKVQHWDYVIHHRMGYLEGCATKYVSRAHLKGKFKEDLQKAAHYVEKLIEVGRPSRCQDVDRGVFQQFVADYDLSAKQQRIVYELTAWTQMSQLHNTLGRIKRFIDMEGAHVNTK